MARKSDVRSGVVSRRTVLASGGAAGAAALAGCGGLLGASGSSSSGQAGTLEFWHIFGDELGSTLETMAEEFSQQTDGITIKAVNNGGYLSQGEDPAVHGGRESDSGFTNHGRWLAGYSTLIHTAKSV